MSRSYDPLAQLRMAKPGLIPPEVWDKVIETIKTLRILDGPGYSTRSYHGIGTHLDFQRGPGGAPAAMHPLQVLDASSDGTAKVQIVYGDINGTVPQVDGDSLTVDLEDSPPLTVGPDDKIVYVEIDLDSNQQITGITVSSSTEETPPNSDESTAYLTLAAITVSYDDPDNPSVTVADAVTGSQSFVRCQSPFTDPPQYTDSFSAK